MRFLLYGTLHGGIPAAGIDGLGGAAAGEAVPMRAPQFVQKSVPSGI